MSHLSDYLKFYYNSIRTVSSVFKKVFILYFFETVVEYTLDYFEINNDKDMVEISKRLSVLASEVIDEDIPKVVLNIANSTMVGSIYMELNVHTFMNTMKKHVSPEVFNLLRAYINKVPFKICDIIGCYDYNYVDVLGDFVLSSGLVDDLSVKVVDEFMEFMEI